jgi:RNA polymerase sigma-70 factor, ECF subfamily
MSLQKRPDRMLEGFEKMLIAARRGEQSQLGVLLDVYRGYLLSIASERLSQEVIRKVAPSDLVQETMFQAYRAFGEFRGTSEVEFLAWLKQIIFRKVIDVHRHYRDFAVRDISREIPLSFLMERDESIAPGIVGPARPNEPVSPAKDGLTFDDVVATLNEEEQQVIQLHGIEELSFDEVGARLGRSSKTARKLWMRAIHNLSLAIQSYELGN